LAWIQVDVEVCGFELPTLVKATDLYLSYWQNSGIMTPISYGGFFTINSTLCKMSYALVEEKNGQFVTYLGSLLSLDTSSQ
jgi:hypothetical protein